jgi:hypothetical protein
MTTLKLDIDLISEELYSLILKEFKDQHPAYAVNAITDWEITCIVDED